MWSSCLSLWSGVLLVLMTVHNGACGECAVYYLDQPVNHLTCNPRQFGLRLECTIYHSNAQNYDIYWYKIPVGVDRATPQLVNVYRRTSHVYNNIIPGGGRIINSRFRIRSPDSQHSGIYWCQIVLKEGVHSLNGSLKPSTAFVLHSPAKYSMFPPCSDEDHSLHQSTCATTGEDIIPPSLPKAVTAPNDVNTLTTGTAITDSNSVSVSIPSVSSNPVKDLDANELVPPWGYAVIAGGGAITMIIISVILCTLLVFCQSLQKYKAGDPLKAISEAHNAPTHNQKQGRPLVLTRTPDVSLRAKLSQDTTPSYMMTTAFDSLPGPFLNTKYPPGTEGTNILGNRKGSPTSNNGDSCSFTSASSAEINNHIYHTINSKRLDTIEAYDVPSNGGSRHDSPSSRSPKPQVMLMPGSPALAQPKSPPPRLWNSPKSTMCPRTRKLPPIPSSQTSGIATAAGSTRETSRSPTTVVNRQQSGQSSNNTQYQRLSPETRDYMSLYSTPHTSSMTSLEQV